DEAIVEGITKIANSIYKRNGYMIRIDACDVRTVLEAEEMLIGKIQEQNNGNNNDD
ncbi:unnamed protein product, partial [marine sediment metagenome]